MSKIKFLNTQVDNVTMNEAIHIIDGLVKKKGQSYVVTPNLDHIVMIEDNSCFKEIYDNASLVLTDGQPLIWISKLKGIPIVEKVSGSDLFPQVCEMAARRGYTVYILGAADRVAEKAAQNLTDRFKGLQVVGTYSPSFGFENKPEEVDKIIKRITSLKPDILAVSLGSPKGENFIYHYRERLNVPVSMSIGAAVDFEAGNVQRAPKWMSICGLEWLYRTMREPKRLAKRYWHDLHAIIPIIIKY
ncbi:MAG: WecB/TagA/CpsF family glycosyltransferase [Desulfosporosinus sp.]|nr:WecB/TagA/CpsF family glycosyltransferase [Desulfosporosinus sp.]